MKFIERTKGLIEPTIEELTETPDLEKTRSAYSGQHGTYAIIGDEQPETLKNMAQGSLYVWKRGITFYCHQIPQKIPKGLKDKMSLMLSYGAWQAAGVVGVLAKHAVSAVVESINESRKDPNEKTPEEILSFEIPIINIVGADNFSIPKGTFSFSSTNVIKILTKNSKDDEFVFWIEAGQDFINGLFELRCEEEKAIGVADIKKFKD